MNSTNSRPKKSPSSRVRKAGTARCTVRAYRRTSQRDVPTKVSLRREFRDWRAALSTPLERDTLLVPEWIAESVVREAERYLRAELPAGYVERLMAKAHLCYAGHRHFKQVLNRSGNRGRDMLFLYMRHWTCSWLKRDRSPLFKHLPWSYGHGKALP